MKSFRPIAKAMLVVGLAAVSAWIFIASDYTRGAGWGLLAVLVLFFAETD